MIPMTQAIPANNGAAISHSSKEMSDEWLVAATKDGNVDAFAELRDRHSRRILWTAYRITKNWEDAEDALQDAFLKAFTHLNEFEDRCRFSSWVMRIAINMSLMILRKKRANKELSIDARDNDSVSDDRWQMGPQGRSRALLFATRKGGIAEESNSSAAPESPNCAGASTGAGVLNTGDS